MNGFFSFDPTSGLTSAIGRVRKVNTENAVAATASSWPASRKIVGIQASIA